jgi:hypothetical protein
MDDPALLAGYGSAAAGVAEGSAAVATPDRLAG